jgi:diguanylate cyclase (GGDEF)-like protein/PAS domain S-box-containing protein
VLDDGWPSEHLAAPDEAARLAALRRYRVLEYGPKEPFAALVRLAAHVCGTPIAAMSLVDEGRQWFLVAVGLDPAETNEDQTACAYTIQQRGVLEICDALADPRFAEHAKVAGPVGMRFYAGSPLVTPDGYAIGTLCVIDTEPRQLDDAQKVALRTLADQAMAQVILRQHVATGEVGRAEIEQARAELRASESWFRAIVENSLDVIVVSDEAHRLMYVSPSALAVLGYEPDELVGMRGEEVVDDAPNWARIIDSLVRGPGETSQIQELSARHRDGSRRYLAVRSTNLLHDPAIGGVVSNCRDITDRRAAEDELERTRAQVVSVLETANDAYVQIDAGGRITEWNHRAERTFGWTRSEVLGRSFQEIAIPEQYRRRHSDAVAEAAARHPPSVGTLVEGLELEALRRDGTEVPVEITVWATESIEGLRFSAFVRDVTERRALEARLAHDALHDELTGLPNRALLRTSLQNALKRAERTQQRVAVLFCDLDRFKVINDGLGHSVGDGLLRVVADRLQRSIRSADTVARFGGDEFVIVFDGVTTDLEAVALGRRAMQIFAEPFRFDDVELFITASMGVAVGTATADAEDLIRDADAAMYRAKETGRARLELFDHDLRVQAQARHDLEQALRRALEREEFRLLYQPVVSLDDGVIVGAEALVRWQHPDRGLLGPSEFIGPAEESGLILPLGGWVLDTACRQLEEWDGALPDRALTMAVNVSARQLAAPTLLDDLVRVLSATGRRPGSVILELTETVLLGDIDGSCSTLEDLKALGVRIAVDDFGTGYSSLAYLKRFPIDMLKIDKSFIDNLGDDPFDSAIVAAIAAMGTQLGQDIVAEGVENPSHARMVKRHRCSYAQGELFSGPVDADRFLRLLQDDVRYDVDTLSA